MEKLFNQTVEEDDRTDWSKGKFKCYKMNFDGQVDFCSLMVKHLSDCNVVLTRTKKMLRHKIILW